MDKEVAKMFAMLFEYLVDTSNKSDAFIKYFFETCDTIAGQLSLIAALESLRVEGIGSK